VTEADAGVAVPPGDAAAIAAAIERLAASTAEERGRLGCNGRQYLRAHLDMRVVITKYERVLQETARLAQYTPAPRT
jgi:colanic acid biosynthesis glycosyl transferase WcaI